MNDCLLLALFGCFRFSYLGRDDLRLELDKTEDLQRSNRTDFSRFTKSSGLQTTRNSSHVLTNHGEHCNVIMMHSYSARPAGIDYL